MTGVITDLITGFNYFVGFYYLVVNCLYSVLLVMSLLVILRHIKRIRYSLIKELRSSPDIPPVSILIAAHNEQGVILRSVNSALSLDYLFYDVIVINDGSDDRTLEILIESFKLRKIDIVYRDVIKTWPVKGFYYNAERPNLLVIDKEQGGKADALNCGINASRNPYVCCADADSILENDAVARLMAPVLESAVPIIACGGVVRVLNGTRMEQGPVTGINLPKSNLALFQIVEYLRAFLFGRVGWDAINSLLILSGTFSLFDKAALLEVGGYDRESVTEDMELIVKLHKHHAGLKKPYKIKFVSDPICWTEVPENLTMLGRQRRRWHVGLVHSVLKHRSMVFNPAYGKLGLIIMPYYLFFEALGPCIEILGYISVFVSFFLGLLNFEFLLLFLTLAIVYGVFLSTTGVFLEELTYRRYPQWHHLFVLLMYGVLENFGYRQLSAFWRFQALIFYLQGKREWEYVRYKGVARRER
jgi:cellulose synthase/poly-beta-1,6-N-acetylglucosamine synthase-like glycosyltransferase